MSFRTILPARKGARLPLVRVGRFNPSPGRSQIALLFRKDIVDALGKAPSLQVDIGQDEDAGKLRVAASREAGGFTLQTMLHPKTRAPIGTYRLRLPAEEGDVQRLPPMPAKYEFQGRALIVTLPEQLRSMARTQVPEPSEAPDAAVPLAPEDEDDEPEDDPEDDPEDEDEAEPDPALVAAPPPAKKGPGSAKAAAGQLRIDNTLGEESLSYGGKTLELTMRQAKVLAILAKAMPHPVSHAEIVKRAWGGVPPVTALGTLDEITRDMRVPFADMGLVLMSQKGVGMWLHIKGA